MALRLDDLIEQDGMDHEAGEELGVKKGRLGRHPEARGSHRLDLCDLGRVEEEGGPTRACLDHSDGLDGVVGIGERVIGKSGLSLTAERSLDKKGMQDGHVQSLVGSRLSFRYLRLHTPFVGQGQEIRALPANIQSETVYPRAGRLQAAQDSRGSGLWIEGESHALHTELLGHLGQVGLQAAARKLSEKPMDWEDNQTRIVGAHQRHHDVIVGPCVLR